MYLNQVFVLIFCGASDVGFDMFSLGLSNLDKLGLLFTMVSVGDFH